LSSNNRFIRYTTSILILIGDRKDNHSKSTLRQTRKLYGRPTDDGLISVTPTALATKDILTLSKVIQIMLISMRGLAMISYSQQMATTRAPVCRR
jgi:hypothetical protein